MIVADVNLIAHLMIRGELTPIAQRVREADPEWAVPPFWRIEFQSILWKWVRHGGMPAADAGELLDRAVAAFGPCERQPPWGVPFREAVQRDITVYDSQYIALALHLGVRCVTVDRELLRKCPGIAMPPDEFLSLPANTVREDGSGVTAPRPASPARRRSSRSSRTRCSAPASPS